MPEFPGWYPEIVRKCLKPRCMSEMLSKHVAAFLTELNSLTPEQRQSRLEEFTRIIYWGGYKRGVKEARANLLAAIPEGKYGPN